MGSKTTVARALTAFIAQRFLRLATIIVCVIFALLFIGIWLLAEHISVWWWLFALPLGIITIVAIALRWLVRSIVKSIYAKPFSPQERTALGAFTDKLSRLLEARSISLPFIAFRTLWDVVRHRDTVTIRRLVNDSTSLHSDFAKLESLWSSSK